jgi:hypothetical protein
MLLSESRACVGGQSSAGSLTAAASPPSPDAWFRAHDGAVFCACFIPAAHGSSVLVTYVAPARLLNRSWSCGRRRVGSGWGGGVCLSVSLVVTPHGCLLVVMPPRGGQTELRYWKWEALKEAVAAGGGQVALDPVFEARNPAPLDTRTAFHLSETNALAWDSVVRAPPVRWSACTCVFP